MWTNPTIENERWVAPTDNHNETGEFNPTLHGFDGINAVSLPGYPTVAIESQIEQVTEELADLFPFNLDYNSGFPLGVSWQQSTIKHGRRSSSFTSYLGPEFVGRPNLHVLVNAQVTRIIQTSRHPTTFLTVEFAQARDASKEVILSAGTIETPKLLLNSGIGESAALRNLGIQPRVDLPDVGKNLSAHVGAYLSYLVNGTNTFDDILRNATLRETLLDQWVGTDGGGPLGISFSGSHVIFYRIPPNSTIFETHPDPAPGPDSPHIQGGVWNGNLNANLADISVPPEGHFIAVAAYVVTPTSRGSIKLNTTDPFDQPIIDFGCLTNDFDVAAVRNSLAPMPGPQCVLLALIEFVPGGAGGNVVANRLTENLNFNVLLLEAGPSPESRLNYDASVYLDYYIFTSDDSAANTTSVSSLGTSVYIVVIVRGMSTTGVMRLLKALSLVLAEPALAAIYDSFAQLPQHTFDFVIVGGGAGGNVVANRLTENLNFNVLLLEAGPSPEGRLNYTVPFFTVYLREPGPFDWNYTVTSAGLNNRVLTYPRGRILGGCTSLNGLSYARGSEDDYNRYARVTGDPGWGWDELQPYIRKAWQTWLIHEYKPTTCLRTNDGPPRQIIIIKPGRFPSPLDFDNRIAATVQELGDDFPFNEDHNSGSPLGVSWEQSNIKNGIRSSSYTSYLGPEFIARPNLHVLLNAQATRVIQTSTNPVAFLSVEFASGPDEPRQRVTASKEVIIAGGALETPKLLMNSGIGDAEYLTSMGINPRINLPQVGTNLSVHIAVNLIYNVNSTETFDELIRNTTLRDELIGFWNETGGGGPLGIAYSSHDVYTRLPDDSPIFQNNTDPAAGPRSTHLQTTTQNGDTSPTAAGNFMSMPATLLTPTSRGTVRLTSGDPFARPLIDVASLTTDFDIFGLREAVKMTHRFLNATAWQGYILGPAAMANLSIGASDAEIETYLRANAAPNGHIVGTASMSPKGAQYGVVDPDLTVKGVKSLRVVDASVLPFLPTGTTMTTTYFVAERASDMIKATWL
ncbi:Aryl-alcohol oxidase-like protein [Mycena venus]|uniref:Aryl-alcohol oxidase-like protein n=1 Tax=Mycena venus TaxID=2733690 RepID=A0A8H6XIR9_9AGAR|nr:Aryl-alcohol oxidase-like protein [Mycena venus]